MEKNFQTRIENTLPLAVTIGDPAGIGPEIILKAFHHRYEHKLSEFFVLGDPEFFRRSAKQMDIETDVIICSPENASDIFNHALPVLPLSKNIQAQAGAPHKEDGKLVCEAIETGVNLVINQEAGGLITAPINKKALYDAGFSHPGHTEFLAALSSQITGEIHKPVMMLVGPQLRSVPVTIHIPLSEVITTLTSELIYETGVIVSKDLHNRFGIQNPRIAVSGLNPHAGEEGSMGSEDIQIIKPAIKKLQSEGINAFGPLPADTLFHAAAREQYDAVLCMYHDQALIPVKTLAFDDGVNVTLGLPFIRTSPDHGTAYDIAGIGKANPSSMIAALKMASQMSSCEHSLLQGRST